MRKPNRSRHELSCPRMLRDDVGGGMSACNEPVVVLAQYHGGAPQTHDDPAEPDLLELIDILGICRDGHALRDDEVTELAEALDRERPEPL